MRNQKSRITGTEDNIQHQLDINDLIDLFVDLNYDDIHNEVLLLQFRIVANKIGYSKDEVDRVIKLGQSEYTKLMQEINEGLSKQKEKLELS